MWIICIEKRAARDMAALSPKDQERILAFLETRLAPRRNPRELGQALSGPLAGHWKYRVGPFRVVARVEDKTVEIWALRIGNRRNVDR